MRNLNALCIAAGAVWAALSALSASPVAAQSFSHPNAVYTLTDYIAALFLGSPNSPMSREPWQEAYVDFRYVTTSRFDESVLNKCVPQSNWVFKMPAKKDEQTIPECPDWGMDKLMDAYGREALGSALRWLLWDGPSDEKDKNSAESHRLRAATLLYYWTLVGVAETDINGAYLQFVFRAPWFLLTADILLSDSQQRWQNSVHFRPFMDWLDRGFLQAVARTESSSRTGEWPPYGQNHRSWALYNLLLRAHLKHDSAEYNKWKQALLDYIDTRDPVYQTILPNGGQPRELVRDDLDRETGAVMIGGQAHKYSLLNLEPLIAAAKLVTNVSGPDLFSASNPHGKLLRAAAKHVYWFASHPEDYAVYYKGEALQAAARTGALLEPLAGYYVSPELAEYAQRFQPSRDDKPTHTWPTMMHGLYTPLVNLESNERLPLQEFSGDHKFVEVSGNWVVEGDGFFNSVFRQNRDYNVDAMAVAGDPEWMNYEIEGRVKVRRFNASKASRVGFLGRYNGPDAYYRFYYHKATNLITIEQRSGSDFWPLASVSFEMREGPWYRLKVHANGPHMRFTIDELQGDVNATTVVKTATVSTDNVSPLRMIKTSSLQEDVPSKLRLNMVWSGQVGLFADRTDAMFDKVVVRAIRPPPGD